MKKALIVLCAVAVLALAGVYFAVKEVKAPENVDTPDTDTPDTGTVVVTNFEECAAAGNPVAESYPRQCWHEGRHFVEEIGPADEVLFGEELAKVDLIRLEFPRTNDSVASPLTITGEARGYWFFEATFPVTLTDWDGRVIAETFATAEGEWMTEEFVPFTATVEFESPVFEGADENHFSRRGALILKKDNPSGLPENDDTLEITVFFE